MLVSAVAVIEARVRLKSSCPSKNLTERPNLSTNPAPGDRNSTRNLIDTRLINPPFVMPARLAVRLCAVEIGGRTIKVMTPYMRARPAIT